jgi:hypothetical protein
MGKSARPTFFDAPLDGNCGNDYVPAVLDYEDLID